MSKLAVTTKLIGFASVPLFGLVTPLIAWPVVIRTQGLDAWSAIAIGQSVGLAASVLVELGLPLTGPQRVAATPPPERPSAYLSALCARALIFVLVAPLAFGAALLLADTHPVAAALSALSVCVSGLSANWYFIGTGRPLQILLTDASPKAALAIVGALTLMQGAPIEAFVLFQLVGAGLSIVSASVWVLNRDAIHRWKPMHVLATTRGQSREVAIRVLSTVYISLPTTVLQVVSPASVATFAAIERPTRTGLLILQSVPNSLQAYLGMRNLSEVDREKRMRVVLQSQLILGVCAAAVAFVTLPYVTRFIFAGEVQVSIEMRLAASLLVLLTCASRGASLVLIARKRINYILTCAIVSSLLGITTVAIFGYLHGATGALCALVATEAVGLSIQWSGAIPTKLRPPAESGLSSGTKSRPAQSSENKRSRRAR